MKLEKTKVELVRCFLRRLRMFINTGHEVRVDNEVIESVNLRNFSLYYYPLSRMALEPTAFETYKEIEDFFIKRVKVYKIVKINY